MSALLRQTVIALLVAIMAIATMTASVVAEAPPADDPPPIEQLPDDVIVVTTTVIYLDSVDVMLSTNPPEDFKNSFIAMFSGGGLAMHNDDDLDCWMASHTARNTQHSITLKGRVWWCATTDDEPEIHAPIALAAYDSFGGHWYREDDPGHSISSGGAGETYLDTQATGHWCYIPPQLDCQLEVWGYIDTEQDAAGGSTATSRWESQSHMD